MKCVTIGILTTLFLALSGNVSAKGAEEEEYQVINTCTGIRKKVFAMTRISEVSDLQMVTAAICLNRKAFKKLVKMGGNPDARANVAFQVHYVYENLEVKIRNASPFIIAALTEDKYLTDYLIKEIKEGKVNPNHRAEIIMMPIWYFSEIDALGAATLKICDARNVSKCIKPKRKRVKMLSEVVTDRTSNALLWAIRGGDKVNLETLYRKGYRFDGKLGLYNALQIAVIGPFVEASSRADCNHKLVRTIGYSLHEGAVKWLTKKGVQTDFKTAFLATRYNQLFAKHDETYPQSILSTAIAGVDVEKIKPIPQQVCEK